MAGFPIFGQPWRTFGRIFGRGTSGDNRFLLQDRFATTRAAGSLNGTPAEPTGQNRTVIDGNLKAQITGDKYNVATAGVGFANPLLAYPQQARKSGRFLLFLNVTLVQQTALFGWGINNATNSMSIELFTTNLVIDDNNVAITIGVGTVLATVYQLAIGLRDTGAWYFIKGGIYTNWTLIWVSDLVSADLFPNVMNATSSSAYTLDEIRIPLSLYIPPIIAYDTFTRANGALGNTETLGPDNQVLTALAWVFTSGIWTISTNKAIATPNLGSDVIVNGGFGADTDWTKGTGWSIAAGLATAAAASSDLTATVAPLTAHKFYQIAYTVSAFAAGTVQAVIGGKAMPTHAANATYTEIGLATTTAFKFTGAGFTGSLDNVSAKVLTWAELFATIACATADVMIDASITIVGATSGLPAGIVTNLDSTSNPQNFVLVYLDGNGNCVIAEMVAGIITVKQTTAITYSAAAKLRVSRSGTECRVFYNNLAVGSAQTMTANVNLNHGIFDPTALNSIDNVIIRAKGSLAEYAGLDILAA